MKQSANSVWRPAKVGVAKRSAKPKKRTKKATTIGCHTASLQQAGSRTTEQAACPSWFETGTGTCRLK